METTHPMTFAQWIASLLRGIAERLDGGTMEPPSAAEVARSRLRDAQIALLDAEAEAERASHTAMMMRARVGRLTASR